jgi:predicted outer membrane protein
MPRLRHASHALGRVNAASRRGVAIHAGLHAIWARWALANQEHPMTPRSITPRLSLLAALAAVALSGCGKPGDQSSRTAPATSPAPTAAPVGGESGRAPIADDASAKAMLQVLEGNAVALSQQALSRNVSASVADFAREVVAAHQGATVADAGKGGAGEEDKIAAQVAKGQAQLQALAQEKDDSAYMNSYIATMVRSYSDALAVIDAELVPAAQQEATKQELQQARKRIAEQLERAQALASARY